MSSIDDITTLEQNQVKFTGERLVINKEVKGKHPDILNEHILRYKFACAWVKGKTVLDAACGMGYGTRMLELAGAEKVIGVDIL